MVLSYDTRFAFQIQPNHAAFSYPALIGSYYAALHRRNVGVDVVSPAADLSGYRLVLAPALYVLDQAGADALRRYVENGGLLLTTARSGVKDETNTVVDMALPGLLADVCGVEVDEYDTLPAEIVVPLALELPGAGNARLWCDVLAPTTAQVVARYRAQYYSGQPAITLNRFGQGQAMYVGTIGDAALHDAVVGWLVATAGVTPALATPERVEATERWKDGRRFLFLLNHADEARSLTLPGPLTDLLTGHEVEGQVTLEPKGVMILR